MNDLIAESVLLEKLCLTVNHTENVKSSVCTLGRLTSSLVSFSKLVHEIFKVNRHFRKCRLLRFESLFHTCTSEASVHIHQLQVVNSFCRIGRTDVSKPDTVFSRSFIQIIIEHLISVQRKEICRLLTIFSLYQLNFLDVKLLLSTATIVDLFGKHRKRQRRHQRRKHKDKRYNFPT